MGSFGVRRRGRRFLGVVTVEEIKFGSGGLHHKSGSRAPALQIGRRRQQSAKLVLRGVTCYCCWLWEASRFESRLLAGRLVRRTIAGAKSSGFGASTEETFTRTVSSLSASPRWTPRVGGTSA